MTKNTTPSPIAWGFINSLLLIGFLGQLVLVVVSGMSFIVLDELGVKATWTLAPIYVMAPGTYLANLFHKPQAMEDLMFLTASFILNAFIYAAIWLAGVHIWHRWRARSFN